MKLMVTEFGATVVLAPSVAEPDVVSRAIGAKLAFDPHSTVADIGTGVGYLALVAARAAGRVVATDVNPDAVACARRNVHLNDLGSKVEVRAGSLLSPLGEERFDALVMNPPHMPTPPRLERADWIGVADSGGRDGRALVDEVIQCAPASLNAGGRLVFAHYDFLDAAVTVELLRRSGFGEVETSSSETPIGRLTWERLDHIEGIRGGTYGNGSASHLLHVFEATLNARSR
jgi:release factor glutamine methyltransferase